MNNAANIGNLITDTLHAGRILDLCKAAVAANPYAVAAAAEWASLPLTRSSLQLADMALAAGVDPATARTLAHL